MRARKAVRMLVVVALVLALATPSMADWQPLGWAFFGLAAFNTALTLGMLARPCRPYRIYHPLRPCYAPPAGYFSPSLPEEYPRGYFYRPGEYGYYYR